MKAAVDSSVLFDLLAGEPEAASAASVALAAAAADGPLVVCPAVYAEIAAFMDQTTFERFIADLGLQLEAFSAEALRRAADAWRAYANRRGQRIQCSRCGHLFNLDCPVCHAPVAWRQHLITDFLIAGHAAAQADLLITRDRGYYRAYFGSLKLVVPSADPVGGR